MYWYLATVAFIIVTAAVWTTLSETEAHSVRDKLSTATKISSEIAISSIAYWCLVFILSLAIATAMWLILLLLIWVPSDFFQNFAGIELFADVLHSIKPLIYRSATAPGITAVPLLDYMSLYCAFLLGPCLGIWSIQIQYHQDKTPSSVNP